jgi:hypothetical protein
MVVAVELDHGNPSGEEVLEEAPGGVVETVLGVTEILAVGTGEGEKGTMPESECFHEVEDFELGGNNGASAGEGDEVEGVGGEWGLCGDIHNKEED